MKDYKNTNRFKKFRTKKLTDATQAERIVFTMFEDLLDNVVISQSFDWIHDITFEELVATLIKKTETILSE